MKPFENPGFESEVGLFMRRDTFSARSVMMNVRRPSHRALGAAPEQMWPRAFRGGSRTHTATPDRHIGTIGHTGSPTPLASRVASKSTGKYDRGVEIGKIAPRALAPSWRPCGVSALTQGTAHHSTRLRRRPKRFCSARRHTSERAFRVLRARRTRWNEVHYDQSLPARRSRGGRFGGCFEPLRATRPRAGAWCRAAPPPG